MGVQGLWELLAPVGRRVSVETLSGKRLAIDASIWMVQFIKAMRDEKGDMVQNAHLIGFFRRICKLLYLRTKPVFVFDGGTPALKRRTVIARRRQRENAQTKIRKTAEKLLLNRLKDMRLKEQVKDIKNQRSHQNISVSEKKKKKNPEGVQESLRDPTEKDDSDFVAPASMAGESGIDSPIRMSKKSDLKGKGILLDTEDLDNAMKSSFEQDSSVQMKNNQEKLDEMLAASLAAEEGGNFTTNPSTSSAAIPSEEEGSEEDEEVLLPKINGNVDPAILASLPPSMQLDLLGQMREKLMAENRQKYQKVKKAPEKFSELQIEAYLKTVAFRREINEVQRSAGGRAVGGVQTSRIASEANREFIFSSSFSGDKDALTSAREGRIDENQKSTSHQSLPVPVKNVSSLKKSDATVELDRDEPTNPDENIEVYIDERGRLRIRNRHMGIQMTRDIQRNLHLMKEKEKAVHDNDETFSTWENFPSEDHFLQNLPVEEDDGVNLNKRNDDSMLQNPSSIEISFEHDDAGNNLDDEDDIFLQLAAGGPVTLGSTENDPKEDSSPWASDSDWEEVPVEQNNSAAREETTCENASNYMENDNITKFSKGCMEEEAELREAIKKSLLDLHVKEGVNLAVDMPNQKSHCSTETISEAKEKDSLDGIIALKPSGAIHEQSNASVSVSIHGQRGETKQVGTHISSGTEVKSVMSPEKALNVNRESHMLSTMGEQPNEYDSEGLGLESIKLSANSMTDEEGTDFLGEASFRGGVEKCSADDDISVMIDDKKDYTRLKTQSHVTESRDTSYDVIRSPIEIPSDADSKKEGREESIFNDESSIDLQEKGLPVEFSEANLEEEMRVLDQEYVSLDNQQRRLERNAESVSSEMFAECQELLQIFGIPYIIAPMEAEAQCAFMEQSNLVDGIVTDDSDVFLFGARSVYKNIFDDRKYVETYFMKDIEKEIGLDRDKIIRMAMLLGSDYTEGISGIGIVNAIEVVTAFPEEDGLKKFREWVESPDPTILGKAAAKNVSGVSTNDMDERKKIFMDKHRKVSKNWHIPSTFPSEAVTSAYLDPQVDRSTEVFEWGKPDLSVLRKLCWEKFGWNSKRTDDLLLPVLKEYEKREMQLRMEAFYSFSERFAKIRSKRIQKAVKGIGGGLSSEMADPEGSTNGNKKRHASHEAEDDTLDEDSAKPNENERNQQNIKSSSRSSAGNNAGRGRGRAQRTGRGRKRGRSQRNLLSELSDETSDDSDKVVDSRGCPDANPYNLQKVRRSTRSRNPVNYNAKGDDDDSDVSRSNGESPSKNLENNELEKVSPERVQTIDESINSDNVEMGGGLYAYEAETGDAHMGDRAGDDDYRVIGGGFCVDEDETSEADATFEEMQKLDSEKHENKGKRRNEGDASVEEIVEIETGNSSAGGLSAMPFLKRKKRKS